MTKRLLIFILALASVTGLVAQGYMPDTVPNVQLEDARRFVSDPDGILSPQTEAEIDRLCAELRQRGLAEVAVVVLDRVEESSLDMFAHKVLNLWGVGQKGKDNGLVISVVRSQCDVQFEPGYGLEGVLPDALCKRIQSVYMMGPLGEGDFDKGVLDGVTAVYNVLNDNEEELTALRAAEGSKWGRLAIGTLLLILLVVLLAAIAAALNKKGGNGGPTDSGNFGGPDLGPFMGGFPGGMLGRGGFGGFGGGFGGGGFGGGFGGGRSGGGGARSGF